MLGIGADGHETSPARRPPAPHRPQAVVAAQDQEEVIHGRGGSRGGSRGGRPLRRPLHRPRRGHQGRFRDHPRARSRPAALVDGAAAHPAGHHGPRPHRHGQRQRRRWCRHLRPGRPELRADAAVDFAPSHSRARRQPGDGGAPGRRHRCGPRPADQRAVREVLGCLLGGDLFILNFLTIATEFIGVSLALEYFGISEYLSVPLAAFGLIAMTASGSFRRWERFMFIFIAVNFLVIPLAVFSHPTAGAFFHGLVIPGVKGGFNSTSVLLVIAIVGTTVAPWQLFFQQSNIVDKRITPRWINYERADTVIGSLITVFAAAMLMAVAAAAFSGTSLAGHYTNAGGVATGLEHYVGRASGDIFAIILLNASIIGAASVTLATSYAFGDVFGAHDSLHRSWKDAKFFYGVFTGMVVLRRGSSSSRGPRWA